MIIESCCDLIKFREGMEAGIQAANLVVGINNYSSYIVLLAPPPPRVRVEYGEEGKTSFLVFYLDCGSRSA
jgi:hypothetical protein